MRNRKIIKALALVLSVFMVLNLVEPACFVLSPVVNAENTGIDKQVEQKKTMALRLDYPSKAGFNLDEAIQLLMLDMKIFEEQQAKAGAKAVLPNQIESRMREIEKHYQRVCRQFDRDLARISQPGKRKMIQEIRSNLDQNMVRLRKEVAQFIAPTGKNVTKTRHTALLNVQSRFQIATLKGTMKTTDLAHRSISASKTLSLKSAQVLFDQAANGNPGIDLIQTQEMIDLVNRLDRDPLKIYLYLRNQFDYEPYYGFVKGPQQALLEKAGNDMDLAALLVVLLRIAGYQAKFAQGKIRLTIQQAMDWVGTKDPRLAAAFFVKNGIPAEIISTGESYSAVVLDHVWVQAFMAYLPYQGAKRNEPDTWLNLDPSFKTYKLLAGRDVTAEIGIDPYQFLRTIKSEAQVSEAQSFVTALPEQSIYDQLQTWTNQIRSFADRNGMTADTLYQSRRIIPEDLQVFPAGLPYQQEVTPQLLEALPTGVANQFTIKGLDDQGNTALSYSGYLYDLGGKRLTITYKPATPDDEQIIRAYANDPNFPAYLIKLIPQIKLDGRVVASGQPLSMGAKQVFEFSHLQPDGTVDKSTKALTVGSVSAVALDLQRMPTETIYRRTGDLRLKMQAFQNGEAVEPDDTIGEVLYLWGLNYFLEADRLNAISSAALDVVAVRRPSHIVLSYDLNMEALFGVPYRVKSMSLASWLGRDLLVPVSKSGKAEKEKQFLIISGLTASALQHGIFGQTAAGDDPISVLKVIQKANADKTPIITLNEKNYSQLIAYFPNLTEAQKTDLANLVQSGKEVIIPQKNVAIGGWSGNGYIIFDPATSATGFRYTDTDWSGLCPSAMLNTGDLYLASKRQVPFLKVLTTWAGQLELAMDSFGWSYIPAASVINSWFLNSAEIDRASFVASAILLTCPIQDFVTRPSIIRAQTTSEVFSPSARNPALLLRRPGPDSCRDGYHRPSRSD